MLRLSIHFLIPLSAISNRTDLYGSLAPLLLLLDIMSVDDEVVSLNLPNVLKGPNTYLSFIKQGKFKYR